MAVQRSADGDTTTIATYAYDGQNRRVEKVIENCGPEESPGDGGDTTVHFYYSDKWQILETRNGSNQATRQWVWGTQYVDELVLMDVNGSPDSDNDCDPDTGGLEAATDRRYFYHQDRNWNVVAVSMYDDGEGTDAKIVERYAYTPYGEFVVLSGAPTTSTYERGQVKLHSTIGNPFAHQGLAYDAEKLSYQNRWREYVRAPLALRQLHCVYCTPAPLCAQKLTGHDGPSMPSVPRASNPLLPAKLTNVHGSSFGDAGDACQDGVTAGYLASRAICTAIPAWFWNTCKKIKCFDCATKSAQYGTARCDTNCKVGTYQERFNCGRNYTTQHFHGCF